MDPEISKPYRKPSRLVGILGKKGSPFISEKGFIGKS
jgi:hypothetical protein